MSTKPQLPIKIAAHAPHMIIKLGLPDSTFQPGLSIVCDTGSVISVGWAPFILAICKAYPELVKGITYCNNEFQSIKLAGIVDDTDGNSDKTSIGCELKAVVEFFMPYSTATNDHTSIKFSIGNEVSVNCLIGMAFIQDAKLVIDLNDNVIESKILKADPFPIQFLRPSRHLPKKMPHSIDSASSTLFTDMHHRVLDCITRFNEDGKKTTKRKAALMAAYDALKTTCDAVEVDAVSAPAPGNITEL